MQPHERHPQTAAEIAAELEQKRASMAQIINGLRDRLSADALIGDALSKAKAQVSPIARVLDSAVRANPMAAAMTGIGLAWLVLGRRQAAREPSPELAGMRYEALTR